MGPSVERGHREQLGSGDHPLTSAAVDAHLKHLDSFRVRAGAAIRARPHRGA